MLGFLLLILLLDSFVISAIFAILLIILSLDEIKFLDISFLILEFIEKYDVLLKIHSTS